MITPKAMSVRSATKFTDDVTTDEVTGETYGPLKVMCEKEVNDGFGDKALIVRPCIIVGPHDPTDRFTYWAMRTVEEGPIAIPGGDRKVQWIDVRDLAKWIVEMIEGNKTGSSMQLPNQFHSKLSSKILLSQQEIEKVFIPDNVIVKSRVRCTTSFSILGTDFRTISTRFYNC